MAEGIFWIFISFFAALGLFDFFRIIQSYFCRQETQSNVLLVPIGEESDVGAECRIHTAVADYCQSAICGRRIFVVDAGMSEKNREICERLCSQYGLQMIFLNEIPSKVKNICDKKE